MSAAEGGRFNDLSPLQYFSGGQTRLLIYPTEDCTVLTFKNDITITSIYGIMEVLIFTATIKRYP
jgi:hypothetical protein